MEQLERKLGYTFRDKSLLRTALTHSSYANEHHLVCNERLEFLGDSILGFVTADFLYRNFPERPEGEMTRLRADLVCETNLARCAATILLGDHLLLGHGEQAGGGSRRASIVADATESVIAAVYLDGGFEPAKDLIYRLILSDLPKGQQLRNVDYKTQFQELVQRKKDQRIEYRLIGQSGPDHDKRFTVQVLLIDAVAGTGEGTSKKRAEQAAACDAVSKLFPEEMPKGF